MRLSIEATLLRPVFLSYRPLCTPCRTFAKLELELGAGLDKALQALLLSKAMPRIVRSANFQVELLRITDALQIARDENLLEDDKQLSMLSSLQVGHLVPFGQLIPRVVGSILAQGRNHNSSWIAAFLCTCTILHRGMRPCRKALAPTHQDPVCILKLLSVADPPSRWVNILNELAKCVKGPGEINISFLPSTVVKVQLKGFDLIAALTRQPLTEDDMATDESSEIAADFNELADAFFAAEPKMALRTWDEKNPHFYFVPSAEVLTCEESLPRMQTLRSRNKLVKLTIDLAMAFHGEGIIKKILFISHRWEEKWAPDVHGKQLEAIQKYLLAHPEIEFVWFEYAPPSTI